MQRILGILTLVVILYSLLLVSDPSARTLGSNQNIARRAALYGVVTLGAGLLIIAGGIDLSIGSVLCFSAVTFGLLVKNGVNPWLSLAVVLLIGAGIGVIHGLLITGLRLQPFVVTLCSMFIFRGLSYGITGERAVGITEAAKGNEGLNLLMELSSGLTRGVPTRLLFVLVLFALAGVLLHASVFGRYLYAIGSNEQAARYAGIATNRYRILAYTICAMLAALAGPLEVAEYMRASPSETGQSLELYAITGAVIGGCSLRGGEGTVIGILLGTAVLPLLYSLVNFYNIGIQMQYMLIGSALLLGTIADELLKRRSARRG